MILNILINIGIFFFGLFLIIFGGWMSLPEFIRALFTSLALFGAFLFFTRNTRKRIYEEIDRKECETAESN